MDALNIARTLVMPQDIKAMLPNSFDALTQGSKRPFFEEYGQRTQQAAEQLDASCEEGHRFLKDLNHRLSILQKADELTPPDNLAPQAVFRGKQAALRHCLLSGDVELTQKRLADVLSGTQKSPFLRTPLVFKKNIRAGYEYVTQVSAYKNGGQNVVVKRFKNVSSAARVYPAYGFWMELALIFGQKDPSKKSASVIHGLDFGVSTLDINRERLPLDIWMEKAVGDFSQHSFDPKTHYQKMRSIIAICADVHRGDNNLGGPVVLRDIKPWNILCLRDHQLRLCDFETAVYHSDLALQGPEENKFGSYPFHPPEAQYNPNKETFENPHFVWSPKADVFSLGATLFYHITSPLDDDFFIASIERFLNTPRSQYSRSIPYWLDVFLRRCLTTDLSDSDTGRYPNIDEAYRHFSKMTAQL